MKHNALIGAGLAALFVACDGARQPATGPEEEPAVAVTPEQASLTSDKNRDRAASPADVAKSAVTTLEVPQRLLPPSGTALEDAGAGPTIAIATMPAPVTSFDIRVTLTNLSRNSTVGDRQIRALILDCHRALDEKSLTIDAVSNVQPPPSGSAEVTTGNDADDVGPAVLSFRGFHFGESSAFSLDPDTWQDPAFGAIRGDLEGCRVEVVFSGALRGDGIMAILANGSVRASIRQRNP
jgi:hypothetical protein